MQSIKFSCPSCGKILIISDYCAGHTMRCPGCGKALLVPRPEQTGEEHVWRPTAKETPPDTQKP